MSLPQEIHKQVKLLELQTRKLVNDLLLGEYHSAFKGQGMIFSDFREYVSGDDIRHISWPLTARMGKPFIKQFVEERELTIILAVDVSGSTEFGTGQYSKAQAMIHLSALLSLAAHRNNDRVGLLLFSNEVEHFVPPKKGRGHIHRLLRDLYAFKPQKKGTNISEALQHLHGILNKRAIVFLISDFLQEKSFEAALNGLSQKHELIAVVIQDAQEENLPLLGLVEFYDSETGQIRLLDLSSKKTLESYKNNYANLKKQRDLWLKKARVDRIDILTNSDIVNPILNYFNQRRKRR